MRCLISSRRLAFVFLNLVAVSASGFLFDRSCLFHGVAGSFCGGGSLRVGLLLKSREFDVACRQRFT